MSTNPNARVTSGNIATTPRLGRTTLIALGAFLAPAVAFIAVLIVVAVWEQSRTAEQAALVRAREIIDRADAQLEREIRALRAVARSLTNVEVLRSRPAPDRARMNAELFPEWAGSLVWPAGEAQPVFSSFAAEALPPIPAQWEALVESSPDTVIGGIETLAGQATVPIHEKVPGDDRNLILTTGLRPDVFQDILLAALPEGAVGAIVDRQGNFIARSLDYANRVGTPATIYVRNAVTAGGEGVYRGRTFEGFENVSAYHTSSLSGWSAHVAISNDLVDSPNSFAITVAIVGGAITLALAGLVGWLILQDTQRRQTAELALVQAQRVESMGRLTGGIAHDFNNLLTIMIGNLEAARGTGDESKRQGAIQVALTSAKQAASLTRSLLLYARQQPLAATDVLLNDCVREAAEVIRSALGARYAVELDLDPAAGAIKADSSQLASALINLAVNARDAMPEGGKVILRTARRSLSARDVDADLAAGEYAQVSVQDDGPGMPPEIARRAFEPFFTTKDVGKGTGLGLAQVDGFARLSGGAAELETRPGGGTTVTLLFPRRGDDTPAADRSDAAHTAARKLRVLLVEDSPGVRELAHGLLTGMGHDVVACADAVSAETLLREQPFDLLFSDIVLPGKSSGVELARLAQRLKPGIAVVLATGYARDELDDLADFHVIFKPYGAAELARAIDSVTPTAARRKRVLLVEDEPFILMAAEAALADAGHAVTGAGSIAEARKVFANGGDALDVLIVDIGLADGSGLDLALELAAARPHLRVIVASGQAHFVAPDGMMILPKPYSPEQLVKAVATD